MSVRKTIGVLGGMGPEATILFQRKLLEAVEARDDADHIPLIIDMNPQVPSRIARLVEGSGEDPAPVLAAMARRLEAAGAEALAMPCNTAHHYASSITEAVRVPFLNIVDLAADLAAEVVEPRGRVGMLASPAVRMTGLFEKALAARGLDTLWPRDEASMLKAIRSIKAKGPGEEPHAALVAASAELAAAGATFQFVACTEFSLLTGFAAPGARIVDTLEVLVLASKEFSLSVNQEESD